MKAATLSARVRTVRTAPPAGSALDVVHVTPSLRVAERGGLWCVLDGSGAVLAPCASEQVARRQAAAIAAARSSFSRPKP